MNKIYKTLLVSLVVFATSCNKDFMEMKPEGSLLVTNYFTEPSDFVSLTNLLYGKPWFNYLDKAATGISELSSGNGFTTDGQYKQFFDLAATSEFGQVKYAWDVFYGIIAQSNIIMYNLKEVTVESGSDMEKAKNTSIGECKFFRAFSYFYLTQYFGEVPITLNNLEDMKNIEIPKATIADLYKLIIMDLEDAATKLPSTINQPRVTAISAKALLAKVYLTRAGITGVGSDADFVKAKTLSQETINEGITAGYGLMDSYNNIFLMTGNTCKESLFSWQWVNTSEWGTQNTLQSYFAPSDLSKSWDGWSAVMPSIDLINSYEANDKRRYSTIMEDGNVYPEMWSQSGGYTYHAATANYGGPTATRASVRKHLQGAVIEDGNTSAMHYEIATHIIRFADLYLTYTEAALGHSASTADVANFNIIRTRAGLPTKAAVTYEDVLAERRHEFAFEFSYWNDILRYHNMYPEKAKNMLANQERGLLNADLSISSSKLGSVTDAKFVLPIPSAETLVNPKLNDSPEAFDFTKYE